MEDRKILFENSQFCSAGNMGTIYNSNSSVITITVVFLQLSDLCIFHILTYLKSRCLLKNSAKGKHAPVSMRLSGPYLWE